MRKVLIPVDGSDNAINAVRHISNRHVQSGGVKVHLLHVATPLPKAIAGYLSAYDIASHYRDEARKALAGPSEVLENFGVPYERHTARGDKAECIDHQARSLGVDEIVMGTGRKNALTRLIEGSLTHQVMSRADVPVEVIAGRKESPFERYGLPAGLGAALALLFVANE